MSVLAIPTQSSLHSLRLECTPQASRLAREWIGEVLEDWGLEGLVDTAELVVSELAANVVKHTATEFMDVVLTRQDESSVRVAVVDDCLTVAPRPLVAGMWEESGRGLALVQILTSRWGSAPVLPNRKCVWAVVGGEENRGAR